MSNNDYDYENAASTYPHAADDNSTDFDLSDLFLKYDVQQAAARLYQRRNELLRENKQLRFELKICRVALILGAIHGFVSLFN